jgi:hypothetical protein
LECNSGAFDGSVATLSCDGTGSIEALSCRNTGVVPDQQEEFPYDPPRIIRLFGRVGAGLTGSFGGTPTIASDAGSGGGGGGGGNEHDETRQTTFGSTVDVVPI